MAILLSRETGQYCPGSITVWRLTNFADPSISFFFIRDVVISFNFLLSSIVNNVGEANKFSISNQFSFTNME